MTRRHIHYEAAFEDLLRTNAHPALWHVGEKRPDLGQGRCGLRRDGTEIRHRAQQLGAVGHLCQQVGGEPGGGQEIPDFVADREYEADRIFDPRAAIAGRRAGFGGHVAIIRPSPCR